MLLVALIAIAAGLPDAATNMRLDRLLALHKVYGLPLPPPDSQLVYFISERSIGYQARWAGKNYSPPFPGIGFSLDGRTVLGNFNEPSRIEFITCIKPDPRMLGEDVELVDLTLAIQCHARGWTALSRHVYRRWHREFLERRTDEWSSDENFLAEMAYDQWQFRLHYDPGSSLPVVARQLKRLVPILDPKGDAKADREMLRSLDLALVPRNSRPGSDAALIDELINLTGDLEGYYEIAELRTHRDWLSALHADPRYRALIRRGFAAVPALFEHLGDERLTRLARIEFPGPQTVYLTHSVRVKDVILDLLEQLAGESFGTTRDEFPKRVAAARAWFAKARKLEEEQYVLSRLINKEQKREWLNDTLFWLLCDKYPKRLPEFYRNLIDKHPDLNDWGWDLARAAARGSLPTADKRRMLEYAARQADPRLSAPGIYYLRSLDPKRADELLLAALSRIPSKVRSEDRPLVELAAQRNRADEWRALRLAARRAETESRITLLKVIGEDRSRESRRERLAILAEYLMDDALCDKEAQSPRPIPNDIADTAFTRLEVRDFAALQLGQNLRFEDQPYYGWNAEQWAELRARVRIAVEKELARR